MNTIKILMVNNMLKAFNTLGIEGTGEVIEAIPLPVLRAKLRIVYYELIKKEG